ncbi:helix-turn-helix transcriptional regulator [Paraglaciecola sp. 2405UD69-4]|uniref:helix-turn-helix transcriptional regulator n=1 Tax=Paraglaciecola sp. 2405UD69-4 TaxID=3391836 RepID=UPI0039C9D1E1
MATLIDVINNSLDDNSKQPFSVYTSVEEQRLLNVPIAKPLLIVVLSGYKELGVNSDITCEAGQFIFLPSDSAIDMRNIPQTNRYFALLIEFDHEDFAGLQINGVSAKKHYIGKTSPTLMACLQQFVESAKWAPSQILSSRKRELLTLLCHLGHTDILSLLANPQLKDRLHNMFINQPGCELSVQAICQKLAMSESTLRRKLKQESTSVQEIKDKARLGLGLHLLQTTKHPVGIIADKCGYQSQSRFTERFKKQFGLTPSELRKTQVAE